MDEQIVVDLLNKMLAEDPEAAEQLVWNRPYVTLTCRQEFNLEGPQLSLMGILNEILRRHGNDVIVGAAFCSETKKIQYFYPMETKSED